MESYQRKVKYNYTVRVTTYMGDDPKTGSPTYTEELIHEKQNEELVVPDFMDPEWVVRCYLLAHVIVRRDGNETQELVSVELPEFFGDENGLNPPEEENWFFFDTPEEYLEPIEPFEAAPHKEEIPDEE